VTGFKIDWQIGAVITLSRAAAAAAADHRKCSALWRRRLEGDCLIDVRVRQHGFNLEVFRQQSLAKEPISVRQSHRAVQHPRRLALLYDLEATLTTRVRRDRFELTLRSRLKSRRPRRA